MCPHFDAVGFRGWSRHTAHVRLVATDTGSGAAAGAAAALAATFPDLTGEVISTGDDAAGRCRPAPPADGAARGKMNELIGLRTLDRVKRSNWLQKPPVGSLSAYGSGRIGSADRGFRGLSIDRSAAPEELRPRTVFEFYTIYTYEHRKDRQKRRTFGNGTVRSTVSLVRSITGGESAATGGSARRRLGWRTDGELLRTVLDAPSSSSSSDRTTTADDDDSPGGAGDDETCARFISTAKRDKKKRQ